MSTIDPDLAELAAAHGVATGYRDGERRRSPSSRTWWCGCWACSGSTRRRRGRGTPRSRRRGRARRCPRRSPCARTAAARCRRPACWSRDGTRREVGELPAGLEPGWYRWRPAGGGDRRRRAAERCRDPPRTWGWMLQLYALHSARLVGHRRPRRPARRSPHWTRPRARRGRGAAQPAARDHPGAARAALAVHAVEPAVRHPARAAHHRPARLRARRRRHPGRGGRAAPGAGRRPDRARPGLGGEARPRWSCCGAPRAGPSRATPAPDLWEFATFCALAERYGGRWSRWPEPSCAHPARRRVAAARAELAPRVAFHAWVQEQVQQQLARRAAARRRGRVGVRVVHDLAVGCDPEGADGWALQDVLALGVRDRRAAGRVQPAGPGLGAAAVAAGPARRDRLRRLPRPACARCCGRPTGCGSTTSPGLWRLWWVPPGESADRGTYVHYDADVMLAVLTLEAHRAGALVIGEDLGTVEPEVTEALAERHMLGSAVLWFTRDPDRRPGTTPLLPPDALAGASRSRPCPRTTCPPPPGFLRGEHVRVRAELGLLDDVAAERGEGRGRPGRAGRRCSRARGCWTRPTPARTSSSSRCTRCSRRSRRRLVLVVALRRGRRDPPAEPARHRRRVPELAAAAAGPLEELRRDPRWPRVVEVVRAAAGVTRGLRRCHVPAESRNGHPSSISSFDVQRTACHADTAGAPVASISLAMRPVTVAAANDVPLHVAAALEVVRRPVEPGGAVVGLGEPAVRSDDAHPARVDVDPLAAAAELGDRWRALLVRRAVSSSAPTETRFGRSNAAGHRGRASP